MENQPNRKLPEIDVAGIKFYADAASSELIEAGNPDNRISTLAMMTFDDHHEFLFDRETKNILHGRWNIPADELGDNLTWVWIRPIGAIDPQGMAKLVGEGKLPALTIAELSQPIISIGNTSFYIDDIHGKFRELTNRWNCIDFKDVLQGEHTGVYFDKTVKNLPFPHELDISASIEKLPDHIIFAKIPRGEELASILKKVKKSLQDNKPFRNINQHNKRRRGQKF
jgi:hypothetical protein